MTEQLSLLKSIDASTILTYKRTVKVLSDTKKTKDRRYKVDIHIMEYRDNSNIEYRKAITTHKGNAPVILHNGTHEQINDILDQYVPNKSKGMER